MALSRQAPVRQGVQDPGTAVRRQDNTGQACSDGGTVGLTVQLPTWSGVRLAAGAARAPVSGWTRQGVDAMVAPRRGPGVPDRGPAAVPEAERRHHLLRKQQCRWSIRSGGRCGPAQSNSPDADNTLVCDYVTWSGLGSLKWRTSGCDCVTPMLTCPCNALITLLCRLVSW